MNAMGMQNATMLGTRVAAGGESAGSDFAGDGEKDHVVASGGDYRNVQSQHAAVEAALNKDCNAGSLFRFRLADAAA